MGTFFVILWLVSGILLILGIFKPHYSLFWFQGERTKKKSVLLYLPIWILLLFISNTLASIELKKEPKTITTSNFVEIQNPTNSTILSETKGSVENNKNSEGDGFPIGKWCGDMFKFGLENDCRNYFLFFKDNTCKMVDKLGSSKGRYRIDGRFIEIRLETGVYHKVLVSEDNKFSFGTLDFYKSDSN